MSKKYSALLDQLLNGNALSEAQAFDLMHSLASGEINAALAGALLAGLRAKGETAEEIRGFATTRLTKTRPSPSSRHTLSYLLARGVHRMQGFQRK